MSLDLRPKIIAINRLGSKIIPKARRSLGTIFSAGITYLITSANPVEPPNNFAIKIRRSELEALGALDFSIGTSDILSLGGKRTWKISAVDRDQLLGIQ